MPVSLRLLLSCFQSIPKWPPSLQVRRVAEILFRLFFPFFPLERNIPYERGYSSKKFNLDGKDMSEEGAVLSDVGEVSEDRVVVGGEEGSDSGVEIVGESEKDSASRKQADGERATLKDSGGYLHRSPGEIERERRNRRKKRKEEHGDEEASSTTLKKVDSPRWLAPTMNSAAQKRPMCKDGIACCSDDPQHFVNFKHTPHHNFQETSFASRTR